ncbi:hypothetical protein Q7P37_006731 [Cladosporium fusiforme]
MGPSTSNNVPAMLYTFGQKTIPTKAKVYAHTPGRDKKTATASPEDHDHNSAFAPGANMFIRNVAATLLAIGSLNTNAFAEVITVTRYPSTCSAIYTTGSRSITVIQSTITVVPVPYDDDSWNGGTPFVLEIEPDGLYNPLNSRDVPQRSWLTLNGNTSTNPLSAGQYQIRSGQLVSVNGSYLSTNLNVQSQPFAIAPSAGTISTTFTFKDGVLNWTSPRFTNGRAQFYKLPVGLIDNAQVLCKFIGPMEPGRSWTPIVLRAKPCDEVNPLSSTSSAPTGRVSVSTSITLGSMSTGPPNQYSSHGPPPYSSQQVSTSSSRSGPSISTPPPPYISSTTTSYILPSPTTPTAYPGPSSSSSSRGLSSASTPPAYTQTTSSSVSSSRSTSATVSSQGSSSSIASSSLTAYTRTSSSPMDSSSSSAGPPLYGSQTPSVTSSSSSSTSFSITFASSGSPIGPINPSYERTSSSSNSSTTSMSMSSSGARTSTSGSSTSSTGIVPPSYTPPSVTSSTTRSSSGPPSSTASSTGSSGSTSSTSASASMPPEYSVSTPPSSSSSSLSSSSSISSNSVTPTTSSSSSSSNSMPPTYPEASTTSSSSSSSSSSLRTSTPSGPTEYPASTTSSTTSTMVIPPFYTNSPQPCPEGNNSIYVNSAGNAYTIYCNMDSEPGTYDPPVSLDFTSCIQACDFDPQCGCVVNLNKDVCYFKPTPVSYVPGIGQLAVRIAGPPIYPGMSSSSSGSSSWSTSVSSPIVPWPTTTTTTTSTSSSSSGEMSISTSSPPSSSPSASSSSSSEVPDEYEPDTTTTTTTTTSTSSSSSSSSNIPTSTSSEVPEEYEQTTSSSSSSVLSTTSSEVPEEYEQTTSSSSSSVPSTTSSEVPDEYAQTTTTTTSTSSPAITTTTTTTSSSPSSTSATSTSSWRPYSEYLRLPSPTPCDFGGPPNVANDDDYCQVDLPFDMTLYGTTSRRTYPSTNGYIALNRGSQQFLAKQFPYPGVNFPDNVLAAFFDDLYMYGNLTTRQGTFYQIENSRITYEYYVARAPAQESIYHFTVAYDSLVPNVFTYRYYAVGDAAMGDTGTNGAVAFVGMQGMAANSEKRSATYSWRETKIEPGLMVVCDGNTNQCIGALP